MIQNVKLLGSKVLAKNLTLKKRRKKIFVQKNSFFFNVNFVSFKKTLICFRTKNTKVGFELTKPLHTPSCTAENRDLILFFKRQKKFYF